MEPRQAINLLDGVLAQVSLNRETHAQIVQAVGVLNQVITILEQKQSCICKEPDNDEGEGE